ncbi:MAG: hypothetical protein Q4C00_01830 [Bacillota bacterium]|nr:hypothetical protein [Bacillota bacterium]
MKKITLLFSVILLIFTLPFSAQADVDIDSECVILMDMDTGQILYEKNGYQLNNMGNMTKLLNVSTALNNSDADQFLSVTSSCLKETTIDPLAGNIGLQDGQMISLEDALYAEILANANDAARVVAGNLGHTGESETIGPSEDIKNYLEMMKWEGRYLTAASLSIASVMGMWSSDQTCNTVDLANMVRLAFENSTFRRILTAKEYEIPIYKEATVTVENSTNTQEANEENTSDSNSDETEDTENTTNQGENNEADKEPETKTEITKTDIDPIVLSSSHDMVNGAISNRSVKGGFVVQTDNGGYHSVTYSKRNVEGDNGESTPIKLVVAIMNSPDEETMYSDIDALLNYGYKDWEPFTLKADKLETYLPKDISDKKIVFSEDMVCLLPKNMGRNDLEAETAVNENNSLTGTVTFKVKDVAAPVYTATFYEDDNSTELSPGAKVVVYALCALAVLVIIFLLLRFLLIPYYFKKKKQQKNNGRKNKGSINRNNRAGTRNRNVSRDRKRSQHSSNGKRSR